MARPYNGGWDFVKAGGEYQYKEDWFVGNVKVIEDNSDSEWYRFKLQVFQANCDSIGPEPFDICYRKDATGAYSGQMQFYENPEYIPLPLGTEWPINYVKGVDNERSSDSPED